MTDEQLLRTLNTLRYCVSLNCFGTFEELISREMTQDESDLYRHNLNRDFESALNSYLLVVRSTNNYLLGPLLHAHKIKVSGLAMSFDVVTSGSDILRVYEETKKGFYQHADALKTDTWEDRYLITTCYANVIPRDLELEGFTLIENKAIDLCFQQARINSCIGLDEDLVKHKIYMSNDGHEFIRVINYYIASAPYRNTDFNPISGSKFSSPEEHIYLALLPVLAPTLKEKLSKEELELFRILAEPYNLNSLAAKNRLKAVYSAPMYADVVREEQYKVIREQFKHNAVSSIEASIEDAKRRIENFVAELKHHEERLQDLNKYLFYTKYRVSEVDEQLDYIFNHPYIKNIECQYSTLVLTTRIPLSMWDPEVAETIKGNLSNIFNNSGVEERHQKYIRFFFDKVLLEQVATYWTQGLIHIDTNSYQWSYRNRDNVNGNAFVNLMEQLQAGYNPHIEHYNCQGTHKVEINRAATSRDLVAMIEALFNPYKNWNLTDGAVLSRGMDSLFPTLLDRNIKCLEYQNEMYSIIELYDLLNSPEEEVQLTEEDIDVEIAVAVEEGELDV